jgi:hypothetical protein
MDDFQKKVVGVALFILICILASTYYLLNYSSKTDTWPPYISTCPDYWYYDTSANVCVNSKQLGNDAPNTFDPNSSTDLYNNQAINTNCGKYNFATQYELPWEGISYAYSVLPCSQPQTT